jgi:heat shock protein HtpX
MPKRPPKSIGRDRGLQARMAFAALLLAALYVLLITVLVAAGAGVVAIAVIVAVLVLAHYLGTERMILAALGARSVGPGQASDLYQAMERVCVLADRPMPRLALIDSAVPNAFTVARSPLNATVCVTGGLLALLVLITLGSVWAAMAAHVVRLGRRLPHRRAHRQEPGSALVILAGLLFVVSYVTVQALSRRRQLSADRAAFLLTSGSDALGSALRTISEAVERLDEDERRGVCGELTLLSLIPVDAPATVATIFPTHPPLELRLARLIGVGRELFAAS